MTPHDPRHGTPRGYYAGCRDECCADARAKYEKLLRLRRLEGTPAAVPAIGAQRRIQALMWQGWSATDIAKAAGWSHRNALHRILKGQQGKPTRWLERKTHDRVVAVFKTLWATQPTSPYAKRTAMQARAKGYVSALAWDDIDHDHAPLPKGRDHRAADSIDHAVVERMMAGGERPGRNLTTAESAEIVRRARARGMSSADIEDVYGIKAERHESGAAA